MSATAGLITSTFRDLRDLIYEQTGLFFPDNKKYVLESRLQPRLKERKCTSYEDYLSLLKYDAWRDREWNIVFDLVTTNETFFYRDLPQLQAFTDLIVPAVGRANAGGARFRVWSAACSTGDEAYTLAILMLEHPALLNWSIEIIATDLSDTVLGMAQAGVYSAYAVRNVPAAMLKKYFDCAGGQYTVSDKVKRLVKFSQMNLYDSVRMKLMRGLDVIFCRNCLIYFDDRAKQRIVTNLSQALRPNGYLVIGFSESLHGISTDFTAVHSNRSVVYQKT